MRKWLINGFCHKSTRLARSTVTRPVERPSWVRARSAECESGEELAIIRTVVQIKHKARAKRRWTEIAWRCVKSVDYFICTKCSTRSSVGFPLSHLRQHSSRAVIGARAPLVVWSDKRTAHTHTHTLPLTQQPVAFVAPSSWAEGEPNVRVIKRNHTFISLCCGFVCWASPIVDGFIRF